ncbi:MAG: carboxypeptidase regulatory-like domain-containing protein [Bacteroidia bacterium]|nr:carboxypeptidase regulatory-like domain-containing protein [Bacteroidia bacterium]
MVNTIKSTQVSFYNQYYQARIIIDLGSTTGKIRGTIKDSNGDPVPNAIVSLNLTGQAVAKYKNTTDADGKFNIPNVHPDDYDIYVDATGFIQHKEMNVHFAPGKELKRVITLLSV